jgi:protein-disulfide isomerase
MGLYRLTIDQDKADALRLAGNATPVFFINGNQFNLTFEYPVVKAEIEKVMGSF